MNIERNLRVYHESNTDLKRFEITLKNNNHPFTVNELGWNNILSFRKRKLERSNLWQEPPFEYAICEIFIIAERTDRYTKSPLMDVCAVAPAHLVLDKKQTNEGKKADSFYSKKQARIEIADLDYNRPPPDLNHVTTRQFVNPTNPRVPRDTNPNFQENEIDSDNGDYSQISRLRGKVRSQPANQQFLIKTECDPSHHFELASSSFLSFRHKYYKLSDTQSSFCCPELKCDLSEVGNCPHRFLNDIALFRINHKLALYFYKMIEENNKKCLSENSDATGDSQHRQISAELKHINTEEDLRLLSGKNIMIKGMKGKIIYKSLRSPPGQKYGLHITFTLRPTADLNNPAYVILFYSLAPILLNALPCLITYYYKRQSLFGEM